jgi:hypothetical protein
VFLTEKSNHRSFWRSDVFEGRFENQLVSKVIELVLTAVQWCDVVTVVVTSALA